MARGNDKKSHCTDLIPESLHDAMDIIKERLENKISKSSIESNISAKNFARSFYHRSLSSKSSLPFGAYAIRKYIRAFSIARPTFTLLSLSFSRSFPLFLFLTHSLPHSSLSPPNQLFFNSHSLDFFHPFLL